MKYCVHNHKGFGLIEALVSIAVFSVLAISGTAGVISVIDSNQKSQTLNSVMTNLNTALEDMARSIRTGSEYDISTDGKQITFKPDRGCEDACITYSFNETAQTIERTIGGNTSPIIADEVKIENMSFSLIQSDVENDPPSPYGPFPDIHFANKAISSNKGDYGPACISSYQDPNSSLGEPDYKGANWFGPYNRGDLCKIGTWETFIGPFTDDPRSPPPAVNCLDGETCYKPNVGVYSMGWKGTLILGFPKYLTNSGTTDNDVWVYETGRLLETVKIYGRPTQDTKDILDELQGVVFDGENPEFVYLGTTEAVGLGGIDIDAIFGINQAEGSLLFDQIKIVDAARQKCDVDCVDIFEDVEPPLIQCENKGAAPNCDGYINNTGADIDAVGIIHTKPKPDQPAVLLRIKGYAQTRTENRSSFLLQTLVSQRVEQ